MKKMKQLSLGLVLGLLTFALLCSGAYAKDAVIGFTGPLSGPGAGYGRDCVNGLQMAAEDINKAGGITVKGKKYQIKLETYDDMIRPPEAVNNARRLVARSGAVVIFNPVFNTIAPLMQINEQAGSEFLMMAYSSTPKIEEIPNSLTTSVPPPFTAYVRAFSEIAWSKGWRKGAMVVTLGAYGDEWRHAFKEHWISLGGQITADKPANYYTETDFSAQLSAALATDPEFMLIGGPSEPTGLVIEQARNLGFKGGFILVDQAKQDYIADVVFKGNLSKMNNVIGVAAVANVPSQISDRFNADYNKRFKVHNTFEAILHYSAMYLVAAAMEKAGSVDDPRAIKAAIANVVPQDPAQVPAVYLGTLKTKLLVAATVGVIEDNQYKKTYQYIWWAKDKPAFEIIKKALAEQSDIETRWMPLEGYLQ
ncbi:ABC transporter substrate-binding protein [bacterium]|nr:ABC transporter substrate-binding protein [bacterium]